MCSGCARRHCRKKVRKLCSGIYEKTFRNLSSEFVVLESGIIKE